MQSLNSSLQIQQDSEEEDEVFNATKDRQKAVLEDDEPLDLKATSNGKQISRYRAALSQLQPIKIVDGHEASRIDQAGCLSFITYSWIFPYLWSTYRGLIPTDQQWTCSTYDSASVNVTRLEYLWKQDLNSAKNSKGPSLIRTVLKFMKTRLIFACFVFLFCLIFGFIGPSCLIRALLVYTEKYDDQNRTLGRGLSIVFGLTTVELLRVLSYGATWAISHRTALRVRSATLGLLYKKLLTARGLSGKGVGNVVNSFSNDGQRLFDAVTFLPLVIMGPWVLVGGLIYLCWLMGPLSLLGLVVFIVFDIFQYSLGKTMVKYRERAIEKSNERIKIITEIIQCIKTIKMNAWEYPFIDKVREVRVEEKRYLAKAGYAQSLAIAAGPVVPVVAAAITFSAYILAGYTLDASTAFSAVTVFFVMVFGIRMIPYGMRYCSEASVSLKSIQSYLLLPEVDSVQLPSNDRNVAVEVKNASFIWDTVESRSQDKNKFETKQKLLSMDDASKQFSLNNINLKLKKKHLIGICGSVGSGKSSLLQAISGEMIHKQGNVHVNGSFVIAPQDSWILNTTFRENVVFGEIFDQHKYYKILYACNLNPDINAMPAGDQTEIGERGATLSGGQKARMALARVLYSNRDVYLLDDFFVSLDPSVSSHVFDFAIRGFLVDKAVLLVTNNVKYLSKCDEIVFMKAGRAVDQGPHEEVLLRCDEYASFCQVSAITYSKTISPIDNAFEYVNHNGFPSPNSLVARINNDAELMQKKQEAKLIANSALSAFDSNYDIPSAVNGQLIEPEEDFGLSGVSRNIYKTYIFSLGGYCTLALLLFAFMANVGSTLFSTVWLSVWLKTLRHINETINNTSNLPDNYSFSNNSKNLVTESSKQISAYFVSWYFASIIFLMVTSVFKALLFVKLSLSASSKLHNKAFHKVIHATMRWFDTTPLGRIINRFSKDVDELDVKIPFSAETFVQNIFQIAGYLLVITWVFPWFLLACIPLGLLFFVFVACFRSGIRCLKRAENNSRSPMFSHIESTLQGAIVIRSFGRVKYFTERFKHLLDNNSGSMFMYQSAMRWLAVWLDLLVVFVTFTTSLLIVLLSGTVEPAYAGMAVAFAIQMSGIFQFAVRQHAELEAKLTAVERLDYYIKNTEQDPEWYNVRQPPSFDWPQNGRISFRDVQLKYRDNLAPPALKGISFEVTAEEKLGIIGRTGSGKSSIGSALFRLYPLTGGVISIDGMDIQKVGLHELRSKMAAIPQDPILFAGSVRFNIDPMKRYDDSKLWEALEKTHLKQTIVGMPNGLESEILEGGKNFSVGQRQLLCLARALLKNVKILLLDEATSSLDERTDGYVRECLYDTFKHCTLLIIAHRLSSVSNTDKTLLLDSGKVIEFDKTEELLHDANSKLHRALDVTTEGHDNNIQIANEKLK